MLGSDAMPADIKAESDGGVSVTIPAHPTPLHAAHVITSPGFLGAKPDGDSSVTAHAVAILTSQPVCLRCPKKEDEESDDDDTAVVIFPGDRLVRALITGEGTGSCPAGQWIVYLTSDMSDTGDERDPKALLHPYLEKLGGDIGFEAYYLAKRGSAPVSAADGVVLVTPYAGSHLLTEGLDWEAAQGEAAFRAVAGQDAEFFPKPDGSHEDEDDMAA